jgi:hypothetical protein
MRRLLLIFLVAASTVLALTPAAPAAARPLLDGPILPKPEMIINPNPPVALVTQMPVWLAVRDWDSFDTAEGSAVPKRVVYEMGDGKTVTCFSKGAVWKKELGTLQTTDCSHAYTRSSASAPDGVFHIKGHIVYDLAGREIDGPVATLHVVVSEIQSLNVSPNQQNQGNVSWDQSKSPENKDNGGRSGLLGAIADWVGSTLDAIGDAIGMTAVQIGNFIKGFAIGVIDLASGLWQLAELAIRLSPQRMMIDPNGWAKDVQSLYEVASLIIGHPIESLKAIGKDAVRWDTFAEGNYAQGLGELLPNLLLIVASKGAGSLSKVGAGGKTAAELAAAAKVTKYIDDVLPKAAQKAGVSTQQLTADAAKHADLHRGNVPVVTKDPAKEARAAERLEALENGSTTASQEAHFFSRHGADVTLEQLYVRARTGVGPDGSTFSNPPDSSRFLSHELQEKALAKAMEEWKAGGSQPNFSKDFDLGEIAGDGFIAQTGAYTSSSKVVFVVKDNLLYTMYPKLR